jgi:hypothetical protein
MNLLGEDFLAVGQAPRMDEMLGLSIDVGCGCYHLAVGRIE